MPFRRLVSHYSNRANDNRVAPCNIHRQHQQAVGELSEKRLLRTRTSVGRGMSKRGRCPILTAFEKEDVRGLMGLVG